MRLNTFALLLTIFMTNLGAASEALANSSCRRLADEWHIVTAEPGVYKEHYCARNVRIVIDRLREREVDLSQSTVVIVLHEQMRGPGGIPMRVENIQLQRVARAPRVDQRQIFHHVFLKNEGQVYDLDYSLNGEDPMTYLKGMYERPAKDPDDLNNIDVLKRLHAIEVPADEYAKVYDENPETMLRVFRQAAGDQYPLRSLQDIVTATP